MVYVQLLVLFFSFCNFFFYIFGQENLVVRTKNGPILGTTGSTVGSNALYYAFRGIPYAEPPLGNLRFSAPVPIKNWPGTLNATVDRGYCVQDTGNGTEDCLYLNVYTPKIDPDNALPVMVYIHGGSFIEGDSRYESYGPDFFLDDNVVVVTFNYRLGVFGFLSTGDLVAPGNWGIKDQILALTWVQDNIRDFGGDPQKVTVFGESAGSVSISYILQAPLRRNLFRAAIMESGVSLCLWGFYRHPRLTSFNLGRSLGIFTTNSTNLVDRLRKVDTKRLNVASLVVDVGETVLTNPLDGLIFGPVLEPFHDGAAVLTISHQLLVNGEFAKVPLIIGFNSQEGFKFAKCLDRLRIYFSTYDVDPARLIPEDMKVRRRDMSTVGTKIKEHYFGSDFVSLSNGSLIQFVTDDLFVRPINEAVRLMSNYTKVFYYKFSYMGPLGINSFKPRSIQGVGHAEELHYLWEQKANIQNPPESDLLTRRRLVKLWTNFAKTLNPTPEKDILFQNVIWALASPDSQSYLDIDDDLGMGSNLNQYSVQWWQQLYQKYGNPPYDTY